MHPITALASVPLIDIDGTIAIQFVLWFSVFILGGRWLFKPYLKMRAARFEGIEGAAAKAAAMVEEAEKKSAKYETELQKARERAADERRILRTEAATYKKEVTEKAKADAAKLLADSKATVAQQTASAHKELMPQAGALADAMVEKLIRGVR